MKITFSIASELGNISRMTLSNQEGCLTIHIENEFHDESSKEAYITLEKKDAEIVSAIIQQKTRELKD